MFKITKVETTTIEVEAETPDEALKKAQGMGFLYWEKSGVSYVVLETM